MRWMQWLGGLGGVTGVGLGKHGVGFGWGLFGCVWSSCGEGGWFRIMGDRYSAKDFQHVPNCGFVLRPILSGEVLCRIGGIDTFWPGPFVISFFCIRSV